MSHYTCLVVLGELEKADDFTEKLEAALAPYMENCCGTPDRKYMEFYDVEEEHRKEYEEQKTERIVMPDGRLLSPHDEEFKVKDENSKMPFAYKTVIPQNLEKRDVSWSEIYPTFEDYMEKYCGYSKKDEEVGRYGYWQNGEKTIYDICLGNHEQILYDVQNVEIRDRILSGKEKERSWRYQLPVLPMQVLSKETQQNSQDARTTAQMVLEREIWDYLGTISVTPEGTKRIMRDLRTTIEAASDGSLSQNRENKGNSMRSLQYNSRYGSRQYRATTCGNPLPHEAHIIGSSDFGGARWDWYEIGGRWAGFFKLKPGREGLQGKQYNMHSEFNKSGEADICLKSAIDFEGMRNDYGTRAQERWDKVHSECLNGETFETWEEIKMKYDLDKPGEIEKARTEYWDQPIVKKFKEWAWKEENRDYLNAFDGPDEYRCLRQDYIQAARNRACTPFALVKDGKWYERGKMGWWACVSNEKDEETWDSMVAKMYDELSDDTLLVLCDCHI